MFAFTVRFPEYGQPQPVWLVLVDVCSYRVTVAIASGKHPVSIPNLEVKPFSADGTATGRSWESRTSPDITLLRAAPSWGGP